MTAVNDETVSQAQNPSDSAANARVIATEDPRVQELNAAVGGLPAGERVVNLPDLADMLHVAVTKIFDMVRNGQLLAVRVNDVRYVPEVFVKDSREINRFVPGVLALLADGGYSNEEILEFLFTEDDSLPGRPADALQGHLAREVMRRAQSMAL